MAAPTIDAVEVKVLSRADLTDSQIFGAVFKGANLSNARLRDKLAAATLDANLGQHERARQSASQFFTQLRDEIDQDKNSALSQSQRDQANQLLNQRDDLITLLARGDPSSSKRLADLYGAFRKLVGTAPPPK